MKKLFSIFVCLIVALCANAQSSIKGDVDSDGEVSLADVLQVVDVILKSDVLEEDITKCDISGDGEVSLADILIIVDIILGNYVEPDLALSDEAVVVSQEGKATVEITSGSGSYEVTVSNPDIIEATLDGNKVTITCKILGTMEVDIPSKAYGKQQRKAPKIYHETVIVKDKETDQTANINVTITEVESYLTCPDDHHPHIIDLGLPSGTKWACCNVGASKPEDSGGYYAYGETEQKEVYSMANYEHGKITTDWDDNADFWGHNYAATMNAKYEPNGMYYYLWDLMELDIKGTQYDVAHVKWGGGWFMPTYNQQKELLDNCIFNNNLLTSKINGASIYLPAAGSIYYDESPSTGGVYMSSSNLYAYSTEVYYYEDLVNISVYHPYCIGFNLREIKVTFTTEWVGHTVRPVWNP